MSEEAWFDFERNNNSCTVEYTGKVISNMNEIIDASDFEDMSSKRIIDYLVNKIETVDFRDFLKRYLYEKVDFGKAFEDISENEFIKVVDESFSQHNAPHSFFPTSTKRLAVFKNFFRKSTVRRSTVLLLGFGLGMPETDVDIFLKKALQSDGFRFDDPVEIVSWFCFKNRLPYAEAYKLYQEFEKLEIIEKEDDWKAMYMAPEIMIDSKDSLMRYLAMVKSSGISEYENDTAYEEFLRLYNECKKIIADLDNDEIMFNEKQKTINPEKVTPSEFERILYSSIPLNKKGNLISLDDSKIGKLFDYKRLSRQRITRILRRESPVERFDLITLMFFIYAQTVEPDNPKNRCLKYIDSINKCLARCNMYGIYPVNPYEAFVLLCLNTEYSLDTFAEVWEESFEIA